MREPKGLIITSAAFKSGKSVVSAGLTASMLSLGLSAEAVKPLSFGEKDNDIVYFAKVTNRTVYYDNILLNNWRDTDAITWNKLINTCKNFAYPVFLETPGCVSTPIKADNEYFDCTDLSKTLQWPVILTIDATISPYEIASQALSFLKYKQVDVLGFIFTCSKNISIDFIEELSAQLFINYGFPCLGVIPYSPSISVEELNRGNLAKLTQQYVDLHPVQTALDLLILS